MTDSKYTWCPASKTKIYKPICARFWLRVRGMKRGKAPASLRQCVGCPVGEESHHWTLMQGDGPHAPDALRPAPATRQGE